MAEQEQDGATKTHLQKAIKSNKQHQQALASYTEHLEAELSRVERLIELVEQEEDGEGEVASVDIPGSKRAASLMPSSYFLNPESPFFEEASKRSRYLSATVIHPMKQKELDALTEGVKEANHRRLAFEAKRNGKLFWDIDSNDLLSNIEGLDWTRIAEKVTDVSGMTRTPKECETRWLGDRHPKLNHGPWTPEELSRLRTLVEAYGDNQANWTEISQELGTNRTPLDCMQHATPKPHHYWDPKSDDLLRKAVNTYGKDNWNLVARHVSPLVTGQQCQGRFVKSLDPKVRKGNWTNEEDERLRLAVEVYGSSWSDVANAMSGRTNEQCRERWTGKLDPALKKTGWTTEEDLSLLAVYEELGRKWSEVSKRLNTGRTDTQCRRRVEQLLKQQAAAKDKQQGTDNQQHEIEDQTQASNDLQPAPEVVMTTPEDEPSTSIHTTTSEQPESEYRIIMAAKPSAARSRPKPRPIKRKRQQVSDPAETQSDGQPPQP